MVLWACPSRLEKIKTKQNKCLRAICFSKATEDATPYFQILEILKLENIFNLKISSLVYRIVFNKIETPNALVCLTAVASDVHNYNTRYASKRNLYRVASKIWGNIPPKIKSLPLNSFKKQYKLFLLGNQL